MKGKPQGVASAAHEAEEVYEEGFVYSVHHFDLPVVTSDVEKRPTQASCVVRGCLYDS